jgi:hypothetical protein
LVVAGGVEGEFAEEFSGGGVDDADVVIVDEHSDSFVFVGSSGLLRVEVTPNVW